MTDAKPSPALLTAHGADPLSGRFVTPGDGVIALRALLLAALAVGTSRITGGRATPEILATAAALRQLGVQVALEADAWQVQGLGVLGLLAPDGPLQPGPGRASLALLLGLLAPYDLSVHFAPEARPADPEAGDAAAAPAEDLPPGLVAALSTIGAQIERAADGGVTLRGACLPRPPRLTLDPADEVSKTALLLAGLQLAGDSEIYERAASRDHGEKLLAAFGADITVTPDAGDDEGVTVRLKGLPELRPQTISVPGDPSAAGFAIVAALIIKGSELVVENVLINPLRTGLIDTLLEMGGDIQFLNQREISGEYVADLRVRSSWLKGVLVSARHARAMPDDLAALAIAASFAQGETIIAGLDTLPPAQASQIEGLIAGLKANKISVMREADSLILAGDGKVAGGGKVDSLGDPALAMSFAVLGLASRHKVTIRGGEAIADSFPDFVANMTAAGGRFARTRAPKS